MTDALAIEHEHHGTHGRYVIRLESGESAEMAYTVRAPGIRDFNHTFVPDVFRGIGVAARLMAHAIAAAETEGFKIVPTCSYVDAQFRHHPQWARFKA